MKQTKIRQNLIKIQQLAIRLQTKPPLIPLMTRLKQTTLKTQRMKQMVHKMIRKIKIIQIQRRPSPPQCSSSPPTASLHSTILMQPNRASRVSRVRRAGT